MDTSTLSKFMTPGILFLLTPVFGLWLSRLGKPYNGLLFNVHKLIALGAVIAIALQVNKALKGAAQPPLLFIMIALAAICVIALFVSGAMMSAEKLSYAAMLAIHRIAPFLLVMALGAAVYLL